MNIRLGARSYKIEASDIAYAAAKGLRPIIHGLLWSAVRLRRPMGFMLGKNVRIIAARQLHLGRAVSLGAGSYLDCSSQLGVRLDDGVTIREGCWIQCRSGLNAKGAGLHIGTGAYIGPFAVIGVGGHVDIGANCQVGARLTISAEEHALGEAGNYTSGEVERAGVRIGRNCWIGNNVTVLDGVTIGDDVVIGANSLVTSDLPARVVAFGSPATPQRTLQSVGE